MRAAIYARVSTDEQAREGFSLAAQEESARAYCTAMRWECAGVYVDAGKSGSSMKGRDALAALLDDAKAFAFDRVVFWKLDRLSRSLRDLLDISDNLEAANVGIVSLQEAIDTGTATGRMMRSILGAVAEFERETIRDRIKAGIAEKARQGEIVGPLSLGYRRDEVRAVVLDPITAPLVLQLFELYAGGQVSLRGLAEWAAGAGLRSTGGNTLDRLSIRKILVNPIYVGQVPFHRRAGKDDMVDGHHSAIVSRDLFDQVQQQLLKRQTAPSPVHYGKIAYPLTGIGRCLHCGAPLMGSRKGEYRYMRCSTAARHGKLSCPQPMVQAQVLEEQVAWYVADMRFPTYYVDAVVDELSRRHRGVDEGRRLQLQGEIERWRRLFVIGDIREQEYRDRVLSLRRELAVLETAAQPLDIDRALGYLRNAGELWSAAEPQHQRAFVQSIFEAITVDGMQITELRPKPEFAPLFKVDRHERFGGDFCIVAPRADIPERDSRRLSSFVAQPDAMVEKESGRAN